MPRGQWCLSQCAGSSSKAYEWYTALHPATCFMRPRIERNPPAASSASSIDTFRTFSTKVSCASSRTACARRWCSAMAVSTQAGAKVHVVGLDRDILLPGLHPPVVRTREAVGGSGRRVPVPDPEELAAVAEQVSLARVRELDLLLGLGLGRGELLGGELARGGTRLWRARGPSHAGGWSLRSGRNGVHQPGQAVSAPDGLVVDFLHAVRAFLHRCVPP